MFYSQLVVWTLMIFAVTQIPQCKAAWPYIFTSEYVAACFARMYAEGGDDGEWVEVSGITKTVIEFFMNVTLFDDKYEPKIGGGLNYGRIADPDYKPTRGWKGRSRTPLANDPQWKCTPAFKCMSSKSKLSVVIWEHDGWSRNDPVATLHDITDCGKIDVPVEIPNQRCVNSCDSIVVNHRARPCTQSCDYFNGFVMLKTVTY